MVITIRLENPRQGYSETERDISIIPTLAHVDRKESVQWILEGKDTQSFTVLFQNQTPVGQVEVHGRRAAPGEAVKSPALALGSALPGVYRSAVAIADSQEVFFDAASPEMILR